jgi:zinc protease
MRTVVIFTAVVLCLLVSGCAKIGKGDTPRGIVALSEPDSPFIALNIWIKSGSQNDPKGKEGLAALTAALLSEGSTQQDSYQQILSKLYPIAGEYDYNVDKEMTSFKGKIHRDNLESYYTLFKNALLSPGFKAEDFKRIKTQTLNYVKQSRRFSNDEELSKELLYWRIFRGTPYEHPEEGYVKSVEGITLEDVKAFYSKHYTRDNVVVGVAGGMPANFATRVRHDFDSLRAGTPEAVPKPSPAQTTGIKVLIIEKNVISTPVSFGFPISLRRSDSDFYAAMLASSWLGEHRTSVSHLYQVIREKRGMNYGDYSYVEAYPRGYATQVPPVNVGRRSQIFEVWLRPVAMTAPGTLHDRALFAFRAALREVAMLVDKGLTPGAFETQRGYLKNYYVNFGNTTGRRLAYRIDDAFYGIPDPGFLASTPTRLDELTRNKVNASIKKYLQSKGLWAVFITKDAEALRQKILAGTPTNITYAGQQPQDILDEDKIIASWPMQVKAEDITVMNINEVFE